MSVTPVSPQPALFGYQVADDISIIEDILQQCDYALVSNGVASSNPANPSNQDINFVSPGLSSQQGTLATQPGPIANLAVYEGTPYSVLRAFVNNLLKTLGTLSISVTAPTFSYGTVTNANDNQSIFLNQWAHAIFSALQTAGYLD